MTFAELPDPATSPDDLVERLRLLKVWAGDPSYETIKDRVNAAWTTAGRPAGELARRSTVANCFTPGRRRFNTDLVAAIVEALHPEPGYVNQWRQALRGSVGSVRVQDTLPAPLTTFTGRADLLDRLLGDDTVIISALDGMAGVGKTQLAVHAGHAMTRAGTVDRVLFVNLRGFDPAQPPADPAAVLDGFLRLLGMPGQQIPYDLAARTAAYRSLLAGTRTLVVLDNAAGAAQIRPLLPLTPGCRTLITSRRDLSLASATRLTVVAFTPAEARAFLVAAVPAHDDPDAAARIARRCGYLPLALSLVAAHIRNRPGWTLADHADRLDERHHDGRLDSDVEVALTLSYQHLPADEQRLLRLAALHPGPDFDVYAAAALTGTDLATAQSRLDHLCRDHLLEQSGDRYTFHDLVRAYAATRAQDQDPPSARRDALSRLLDHYQAATAAAIATLYPTEATRHPQAPPSGSPAPDLTEPAAAVAWLDLERATLVSITAEAPPGPTIRLARTLVHYLTGGYRSDALTVHSNALRAARASGDRAEEAWALNNIGWAHLGLGVDGWGADYFRQALDLFRRLGDRAGQARALGYLGIAAERSSGIEEAIGYKQQALDLFRQAGDRVGEARALNGLGVSLRWAGRYGEAIGYYEQSLALATATGNKYGMVLAMNNIGELEAIAGREEPAREHLTQSLDWARQLGNLAAQAAALDSLGVLHAKIGRPGDGIDYFQQALKILREAGDQYSQTHVLNSMGEAALAADRAGDATAYFTEALTIATDRGIRDQQDRARAGLSLQEDLPVEARIVVDGSDTDRVALWDWLHDDRDLRGRIRRDTPVTPGQMGAEIEYVVSAVVGAGALWAALAKTISIWLVQRRSDVTITVTGPGGRKVSVSAKRTRDPEAIIREVLDGTEPPR
jgi:tetratricopeptide (TPR) repeat protein